MEDESYEKIREEAPTTLEKAEEPDAAVPQKATEPGKATEREKAAEPEKPQKARARKKAEDGAPKKKPPRMMCEGCGRSYSIHRKRHLCGAPKGVEKKQSIPTETKKPRSPPPPPIYGSAERQITLADVTEFIFAESKARRRQRRDDLVAKMF